jgi:hypothetical protein
MKSKLILTFGLFMVLNMAILCGREIRVDQDIAEMDELEEYLKTAEVMEVEIDRFEGRTAPWGVTLSDGKISRQAIFKYVNRPRPALLPDSYHYEIAAYEVSKLLKYPVVPTVVEREIDDTPGSLHLFLEGCFSLDQKQRQGIEPLDSQIFSDALSELAVFENLVYCERNPEDIYIQENDWKIWRVDYSEAFAPFAELNSEVEITRCSKELFHNLMRLEASDVKKALETHLSDEEIDAFLQRKERLIDKIKQLIQQKEESAVLF